MKWIFSLLLLSMLILAGCAQSELPPEPNAPGAAGNYYKAIGDWATESNTFWLDFDETIECSLGETVDLSFRVDDDFVYKNIYLWAEGEGNWDDEQFSQQTIGNSNWIRNLATYDVEVSCENLLELADENNEIFTVAYSCSQDGDSFDCNNNKWQLQVFSVSEVAEDYDFFFELNQTHTITTDLMTSYDVTFIGVNSLDRADFYIDGTVYSVAEGESVLLGDLNFEVVDLFDTKIPTPSSSVGIRILAPTIPKDPNAPGSSTGETVVDGDSLFLELNKPNSVSYEGTEYDVELVGGDNECLVPGIDSFEFSINGVSERISTADEGSVVTVGSTDIYVEDIFITNIPVTSSSMNFAVIGQGNNSYFVTNDEVLNTTDGVFAISDTVLEDCQQYGDSFVVIDINGNRKTVSEGDFVTLSGIDLYIDEVFVTDTPNLSASANVVFGADEVKIELSSVNEDIELNLWVNGERVLSSSIFTFDSTESTFVLSDNFAAGTNVVKENQVFIGKDYESLLEIERISQDRGIYSLRVADLSTGYDYEFQVGDEIGGYEIINISPTGVYFSEELSPTLQLQYNTAAIRTFITSDKDAVRFRLFAGTDFRRNSYSVFIAEYDDLEDEIVFRKLFNAASAVQTTTDLGDTKLFDDGYSITLREDGSNILLQSENQLPSSGGSGGGSEPVPINSSFVISTSGINMTVDSEFIGGSDSSLKITGTTIPDSVLTVYVNTGLYASALANESGDFVFRRVLLEEGSFNNISIVGTIS